MSKTQSIGQPKAGIPRYANGKAVSMAELDMIAQAFGFNSARHMDDICAQADRNRAARAEWSKKAS